MPSLDTNYYERKEVFNEQQKLETAIEKTAMLSVDEYRKILSEDLCQQQQ